MGVDLKYMTYYFLYLQDDTGQLLKRSLDKLLYRVSLKDQNKMLLDIPEAKQYNLIEVILVQIL